MALSALVLVVLSVLVVPVVPLALSLDSAKITEQVLLECVVSEQVWVAEFVLVVLAEGVIYIPDHSDHHRHALFPIPRRIHQSIWACKVSLK
jgi:hypothetical protein